MYVYGNIKIIIAYVNDPDSFLISPGAYWIILSTPDLGCGKLQKGNIYLNKA